MAKTRSKKGVKPTPGDPTSKNVRFNMTIPEKDFEGLARMKKNLSMLYEQDVVRIAIRRFLDEHGV